MNNICRSVYILNSKKLYNFIAMRWAGHVARMEEGRSAFKILTGNRPLWRPRHRREDNIRIDLEEIGINAGN